MKTSPESGSPSLHAHSHAHPPHYDMTSRLLLTAAAAAGFLGVAVGAFGAHGLASVLEANASQEIWQTAVNYWFIHTLGLLGLGAAARLPEAVRQRVALAWIPGMLIFCGSLCFLATTGPRWLGAITPVGGVLFLIGWLFLFFGIWISSKHQSQ